MENCAATYVKAASLFKTHERESCCALWNNIGVLHLELNNLEEAISALGRALYFAGSLSPAAHWHNSSNFQSIVSVIDWTITSVAPGEFKNFATPWTNMILLAIAMGASSRARRMLDLLLHLEPDNFLGLMILARLHADIGDVRNACKHVIAAVRILCRIASPVEDLHGHPLQVGRTRAPKDMPSYALSGRVYALMSFAASMVCELGDPSSLSRVLQGTHLCAVTLSKCFHSLMCLAEIYWLGTTFNKESSVSKQRKLYLTYAGDAAQRASLGSPDLVAVAQVLGLVLLEHGDIDNAMTLFQHACESAHQSLTAITIVGRRAESCRWCSAQANVLRTELPTKTNLLIFVAFDATINQAHVHAMTCRWAEATAAYASSLQFYPARWLGSFARMAPAAQTYRSRVFHCMSRTLFGMRNVRDALRAIASAIHLRPEHMSLRWDCTTVLSTAC
mmetsp:Transcript_26239/g.104972  ORF Transcript_26239/g.104972 Transcript_26239/m.104972 type:complete len:449 (-) Transcript_26239:651-1997(-)